MTLSMNHDACHSIQIYGQLMPERSSWRKGHQKMAFTLTKARASMASGLRDNEIHTKPCLLSVFLPIVNLRKEERFACLKVRLNEPLPFERHSCPLWPFLLLEVRSSSPDGRSLWEIFVHHSTSFALDRVWRTYLVLVVCSRFHAFSEDHNFAMLLT